MAKTNKNVVEYRKQRKRIQSAIRRLEKSGYILPDNLLPAIPKKVTQSSVNRLKKIDINQIYKKAVKLDVETGEITPGQVAREEQRKEKLRLTKLAKKIKEAEKISQPEQQYYNFPTERHLVLNNWLSDMKGFQDSPLYDYMVTWFTELRTRFGDSATADMLKEGADSGLLLTYEVMYKTDAFQAYISGMLELAPDIGKIGTDEFWDALDASDDWDTDFTPTR